MIEIKTVNYLQEKSAIRQIREEVFLVEQNVAPELEFDEYEESAQHLLAYLDGKAVGTCRFRPYDTHTGKIERLAVLKEARGQKIGQKLMEKAVSILKSQNYTSVLIHAQAYVKPLYEKIGFVQIGDIFEEANIPHIKMIKQL